MRFTTFFHALAKSCYDMEFYRKVRTGSWTNAFRYSAAFFVLVALFLSLSAAPALFGALGDVKNVLNESVPDNTSFEVKDGKFSTTLSPATEFGDNEFALIVDSTVLGKDYPKAFEDRIGIFIGRDAVFSQELDGSREIKPLEDLPNFTVTKEAVSSWLGRWGVPVIVGILLLIMLFGYAYSLLSIFVFVFLTALVSLLASRIWKLKFDYRQWLAIGFHAVTLPVIIDYLFTLIGLDMPFLMPVVYFMFVFAVLSDERARSVSGAGSGKQVSH